jgi:hypothetical protein
LFPIPIAFLSYLNLPDVVHFDGAVHDVSSSIGSVNFICLNSKEAIWGMV